MDYPTIWMLPLIVLFSILVLIVMLWIFQERLLFHPDVPAGCRLPDNNPIGLRNPKDVGLNYEDLYIHSSNGTKLHMWIIKQPKEILYGAPTILYLQSNAGNMGLRLPIAYKLFNGCKTNVALLSYRGFGNSNGSPTEVGLYDDAAAALKYLSEDNELNKSKFFIFGSSIGTSPALEVALRMPELCSGIILENPYTSIVDVVHHIFPYPKLVNFAKNLMRFTMNNKLKIQKIELPILIFGAELDILVPPEHPKQLMEECISKHKHFVCVRGAGHNDIWEKSAVDCISSISKFIKIYTSNEEKNY